MASGGGGAPGEKEVEVEKAGSTAALMSVASEYKQQLSVSGSPQRSNHALLLLIL